MNGFDDFDIGPQSDEQYPEEDFYPDDFTDDAEVLASAGWGTDEDYGYYGDDFDYYLDE